MGITNEELSEWAKYGQEIQDEDHPAAGYVFGPDIIQLWRVVAAIAQRHLDGLPEPTEPVDEEAPIDYV